MENILNLKTYSKYKSLFDDGLILVPDDTLSTAINDVLDKDISKKRGIGAIICRGDYKLKLRDNLYALPIEYI